MRTLEINKIELWKVPLLNITDETDIDGNLTGSKIKVFGTPIKIKIMTYPSNSYIVQKLFGIDCSFDMIAVSNDIILSKDDLLFLNEPISDYETTYSYSISEISKSLNSNNYGLKKRT